MIVTNRLMQEGFTAVELLITLFIAAIFLFSGYQLYTQVTYDGADAEKMAKVSNIVYEKAQKAGTTVSTNHPLGCKTASETPLPPPPALPAPVTEQVSGVGSVDFRTVISCPQGAEASANLFLIKVTATYKNNKAERKVQHALYAN